MRIHLLAVGKRMPSWVEEGYRAYARRLPPPWHLHLVEIPTQKHGKGQNAQQAMTREGARILAAIPDNVRVVALERQGQSWDTQALARVFQRWFQDGRNLAFLIGGAQGLSRACLERAEHHWSLAPLTFPHGLVRIMVAEQIYRVCSLLEGHPYHR